MVKKVLTVYAACAGMILSLNGCITPYPRATGPLNINSSVENGLKQWLDKSNPRIFAVTLDGNGYGYSFCSDIRCAGNDEDLALYSCKKGSHGSECVIYAQEGRYVWNNEKIGQVAAPTSVPKETPITMQDIRPIAVSWEGYTALMAGTTRLEERGHNGTFEFAMNDQTHCDGNYSFTEKGKGNWFLRCENGLTASGTFENPGKNEGAVATGKDNKDRRVTLTVGGK